MKGKWFIYFVSVVIFVSLFTGCTMGNKGTQEELESKNKQISELTTENTRLAEENTRMANEVTNLQNQLNNVQVNPVLYTALNVVSILQEKDMNALSAFIHPNQGVRFSPYPYVDVQTDLVFTGAQLAGLLQSSQQHVWGAYDGSGDPIQLTFNDYYDRFVYDQDYANPHMIGNNVVIGTGNAINNISQVYPQGTFIEFHFTGFDPQYEGMDWRSLSLVFEELNNNWYLVGIVHSEWTI